jgi:hypothetical protein
MTKSIYAKPYVYICEHKVTGKFYIGSRWGNIDPWYDDLGSKYCSSCDEVRLNPSDYVFDLVSEFETGNDAYQFEQKLIAEFIHSGVLINKWCKNTATVEMREKISRSMVERFKDQEKRKRQSEANRGQKRSNAQKENVSLGAITRWESDHERELQSERLIDACAIMGPEVLHSRAMKGWETRRKNKMLKKQNLMGCN